MKMDAELNLWPDTNGDLVIIDSYYVTETYLCKLREKNFVVYIDDLALFPYPVNLLLNYNIYGPYVNYHELYGNMENPIFILGPSYAPLRSMFKGIENKRQKKDARDILISTGGSDTEHIALRIIQSNPRGRNYHILIGSMNSDKKEIRESAKKNENIILHESVNDMRSLIRSCDIAVSAAGSTLYEICACGVPLITYVIAENQIQGAECFEREDLAKNLGDMRKEKNPEEKIFLGIESLANNYEKRISVGRRMQNIVDGYGADRIVQAIRKNYTHIDLS